MVESQPNRSASGTEQQWRPTSAIEQMIWLDHQQVEDTRHQGQLAIKLKGELDVMRLAEAVKAMADSLPDIDARYRFDESSGLMKAQNQSPVFHLKIESAHDVDAALQQARLRRAQKRDLSRCAPLEFVLYHYEQDQWLLTIVAHRIAFYRLNWHSILSSISGYYRQDWQGVLTVVEQEDLQPLWLIRDDSAPLAPRWQAFRQPSYVGRAGGATQGQNTVIDKQFPVDWLSQYVDDAMDHQALLRQAGLGFARQLSALCQTHLTHFFLSEKPHQHGEWNGNWMTSGLSQVTLACDMSSTHSDEPLPAPVVSSNWSVSSLAVDELHLGVSWIADASQYLQLPGVDVGLQRSAMPHPEFDLMLGLGISCDGLLMCQLTVSERVSTALAEYALDGFIEALMTGQLNTRTGRLELGSVSPFVQSSVSDLPRQSVNKPSAVVTVDKTTQEPAFEALLLTVFRSALQRPEFDLDDDFFDAGGHSLIATRILGQLKQQHGIELRINDVFSQPRVRQLAQIVSDRHKPKMNTEPSHRVTDCVTNAPLALAQQSLWKVYSAFGYGAMFNIPFTLRFLKPVDEKRFEHAFAILMKRHPILRSLFHQEQNRVLQQVVSLDELPKYTWFWDSAQSGELTLKQYLDQEAHYPFELATELPVRLRFITEEGTEIQYLSFLFHHLVLDEWSVNILMDELCHVYHQLSLNPSSAENDIDLKPVASFLQFAQQQATAGVEPSHLDYWTLRLKGIAPGLRLPLLLADQQTPALPAKSKDAGGWQELKISESTRAGLYQLAKTCQGSLFNVMYSGIALALRGLGAQDSLLVGTPVSGRIDADYFDTVGYFTTIAVHPVHFVAQTLGQFIDTVKNTINDSMPYTDVPIDHVEQALFGDHKPFDVHMFDVFIQLHAKNKLHGQLLSADHQPIPFEQVDPDKSESPLGLQFEVMEETVAGQPSLRLLMSYRSDRYSDQQVAQILQVTKQTLVTMAHIESAAMSFEDVLKSSSRHVHDGKLNQ
ncbi:MULTISPECIES: condensation domain-containing protein [unclassified Vibrio]|uniref:Condensation domain-containing protein n=1 Tax=Vibrio sp. HB236076 TaxID=3232307 RepID=A0AB39HDB5_9VIBR|nr:condensation domain-containing protein [Vibrio sp. HB161653]MDP5253788.1 condensation domain-containing protein [Vibrio sp. HB161653]